MTLPPAISVLMPCFNPGAYLEEAVASVLNQPECLELLVADGGSTDGSIEFLEALASRDRRVRITYGPDQGPADALNKAFAQARGTMIGWLNADDISPAGALGRAALALSANPRWLMVYGEGEEFDTATGMRQRYPTLQPNVGLGGFRSHCFICQPTVVFDRTMGLLLGPFDLHWRTAFDFEYWLRAFAAFPDRIGYLPTLQGLTRIHQSTITSRQRSLVALEATALLARHFGVAARDRLHCYALELQLGIAKLPKDCLLPDHLAQVFAEAEQWLSGHDYQALRRDWLLASSTAAAQQLQIVQPQLLGGRAKGIGTTSLAFGVNLIQPADPDLPTQLWLEALQSALQGAGVPLAAYEPSAEPGSYAVNLIALPAPAHAHWLLKHGQKPQLDRLAISAWPWIASEWPQSWLPLFDCVDEVWAPSGLVELALSQLAAPSTWRLPTLPFQQVVPVAVPALSPRDPLVLVFADLRESTQLLNTFGAVEVFRQAFAAMVHGSLAASQPSPRLLILVDNSNASACELQWLQACCVHDPRIKLQLLDASCPKQLLPLIAAADVLLSLQRSYSLNSLLAAAQAMGLQVIATASGAALDLHPSANLHLVPARQVPIGREVFPDAEGFHWGEPDQKAAIAALQRAVARCCQLQRNTEIDLMENRCGEALKARLEQLWLTRRAGSQIP